MQVGAVPGLLLDSTVPRCWLWGALHAGGLGDCCWWPALLVVGCAAAWWFGGLLLDAGVLDGGLLHTGLL